MLVEEGLKLGVGGRGRLDHVLRIEDEEGQVAAFELIAGDHRAIGFRGAHARADRRRDVGLGDLVTRDRFESRRGELVFGQQAQIGVAVELAGDGVEEAGVFGDGVPDQLVRRDNPHAVDEFGEGFVGRHVGQHAAVETGGDGVLHRHRLSLLLLDLFQSPVEGAFEIGRRDLARPCRDHGVGDLAVEDVADAEDREGDDQQYEQSVGEWGLREGAKAGEHESKSSGATRRREVSRAI